MSHTHGKGTSLKLFKRVSVVAATAIVLAAASITPVSGADLGLDRSSNFLYREMEDSYKERLASFMTDVNGKWLKLTGVGYGESGDRVVESILGYTAPDTSFYGTSVSGGLNATATICLPVTGGFQDCVYGTVDEPIIVDGPPWLLNTPYENGLTYSLLESLMGDIDGTDNSPVDYTITETETGVIYRMSVVDPEEELELISEYEFTGESLVMSITYNGRTVTRVSYSVVDQSAVPVVPSYPAESEIAPSLVVLQDLGLIATALEKQYINDGKYPASVIVEIPPKSEGVNPAPESTYKVCYNSGAKKVNYVIWGTQVGAGWYWEWNSDLTDATPHQLVNGELPSCDSVKILNRKGVSVPGVNGATVGWYR